MSFSFFPFHLDEIENVYSLDPEIPVREFLLGFDCSLWKLSRIYVKNSRKTASKRGTRKREYHEQAESRSKFNNNSM